MQLRDYQSEAVDAVFDYFGREVGSPLVVAPTGAGKSLIIAAFCKAACEAYPATRILVLTHVKELIQQDHDQLRRYWPEGRASIYSAGLGRKNISGQVVFAGVQSFARIAERAGEFDLVVVDEAHLIPRKSGTLYRDTLEKLSIANPAIKMVGFTATPYRLDSGLLHEGKDAVFDAVCYDIPVSMLVERGYLAPLVSKRPSQVFDLSGLHTRGGEFIDSELSQRFDNEDLNRAILTEAASLGADREAWLIFCIDVAHAEHMASLCRSVVGKRAAVISGKTAAPDRARLIEQYKRGDLDVLTSVGVLTTGFDAPRTDLVIMARPTQSTGLYVQMAGRGMRLKPQGGNCLVLDFAGNVMRHGPVDAIKAIRPKKDDEGETCEAPAKVCPMCETIVHAAVKECLDCGYQFPPPEVSISRTADTAAIMQMTAPEPDWSEVKDVAYYRHPGRDGKPDSLRVEYLIDGDVAKEWVCFEHSGFPRQKAVSWWLSRADTSPPDSVAEALERIDELPRPAAAVPQKNGRYLNISRVRFAA